MFNIWLRKFRTSLVTALGGKMIESPKLLSEQQKILNWLYSDRRWITFYKASILINRDDVHGDIVECGVGCGRSLATLSLAHQRTLRDCKINRSVPTKRRIIGYDSFEGLPFTEGQPSWSKSLFSFNYEPQHPILSMGEKVTPESIKTLFDKAQLGSVTLQPGLFEETMPQNTKNKVSKIALLHIDCDLYQSTKTVFDNLGSAIQDGTIILFDDWFFFKGSPHKGEAGAFNDFLALNPKWQAIHYCQYSVYGNAFIMHDTEMD